MSPDNYVHCCVSNSVSGIQLHLHVAELCTLTVILVIL